MPDLLIPDVSEYQTVDFSVFSGPIIVRAHNSSRPDRKWAEHAAGASRQPWWGAYQYLTKTADPAAAARAFLATLGGYRPNVTILDLEEGDGDQRSRQHAWLSVMAGDPARDWTYSGDYFARSRGVIVEWVAAYGQQEPSQAHLLWQFTDCYPFPGISPSPCDGSIFHGSLDNLLAVTGGSTPEDDLTDEQADQLNRAYQLTSWMAGQDPSNHQGTNGGVPHIEKLVLAICKKLGIDPTTVK